jgi:hypothetical protein
VENDVNDRPNTDETTPTVTASRDRGVGIGRDVISSPIITGDSNVIQIQPLVDPLTTALQQLRAPVGDFVGRELEVKSERAR